MTKWMKRGAIALVALAAIGGLADSPTDPDPTLDRPALAADAIEADARLDAIEATLDRLVESTTDPDPDPEATVEPVVEATADPTADRLAAIEARLDEIARALAASESPDPIEPTVEADPIDEPIDEPIEATPTPAPSTPETERPAEVSPTPETVEAVDPLDDPLARRYLADLDALGVEREVAVEVDALGRSRLVVFVDATGSPDDPARVGAGLAVDLARSLGATPTDPATGSSGGREAVYLGVSLVVEIET